MSKPSRLVKPSKQSRKEPPGNRSHMLVVGERLMRAGSEGNLVRSRPPQKPSDTNPVCSNPGIMLPKSDWCILISWLDICVTLQNIRHMTMHTHTDMICLRFCHQFRSTRLRSYCTVFLTAAHEYACIVWLMPSLYGGIKTGVWPSLFTLLISYIPSLSSNYLTSLDLIGANQTNNSRLDSLKVTHVFKQWLNR